MKISSRFTIAIHILLCIYRFENQFKITSEFISGSVNVNPVIIRRTLGQLKKYGIIDVIRGSGGAKIIKKYNSFTLLDIFKAVESLECELFSFHEKPNSLCFVGKNIHNILDIHLSNAQLSLENELNRTTFEELVNKLEKTVE